MPFATVASLFLAESSFEGLFWLLFLLLPLLGRIIEGLSRLFTKKEAAREGRARPQAPATAGGGEQSPAPTLGQRLEEWRRKMEEAARAETPAAEPKRAERPPRPVTTEARVPTKSVPTVEGQPGTAAELRTPLRSIEGLARREDSPSAAEKRQHSSPIEREALPALERRPLGDESGPRLRTGGGLPTGARPAPTFAAADGLPRDLQDWRRAIILSEVLGRPVAMRRPGHPGTPPGLS